MIKGSSGTLRNVSPILPFPGPNTPAKVLKPQFSVFINQFIKKTIRRESAREERAKFCSRQNYVAHRSGERGESLLTSDHGRRRKKTCRAANGRSRKTKLRDLNPFLLIFYSWDSISGKHYQGLLRVMIRPVGRVRRLSKSRGLSRVGPELIEISWVGSGRVGSGRVGSGRVRSGRVGSGWVGSGRVGSDRVGSDRDGSVRVGSGRVGSGRIGSRRVGSGHEVIQISRVRSGHPVLIRSAKIPKNTWTYCRKGFWGSKAVKVLPRWRIKLSLSLVWVSFVSSSPPECILV